MSTVITGTGVTTDNVVANTGVDSPSVAISGSEVSPFGFRNFLINGNFAIWQRATSQTSSGYGSDDRWVNANTGSTKVNSQQIATDVERAVFNSNYFSRTVVTSIAGVSNYCFKQQKIEDVTKLAGKTVTVSFWAKADTSKNIAIELSQIFGTGGTPSANEFGIDSQLIALTSVWTKYYVTVTIPSIIGKTLGTDGVHTSFTGFYFWFDAGSTFDSRAASLGQQSGTFDIAEVQFEKGSVATPFEQRPIGLEDSLCKWYYEIVGSAVTSYASGAGNSRFGAAMSPKRTAPTIINLVTLENVGITAEASIAIQPYPYAYFTYVLSNDIAGKLLWHARYEVDAEI